MAQQVPAKVISGHQETQSLCAGVNTRSLWCARPSICSIWYARFRMIDRWIEYGVEHKVNLDGLSEKECEDAVERLVRKGASA
jgi:hypothetical protein